jgi:hypothetical protein
MATWGQYLASDIVIGPGALYFETTPPAAGSKLVIDANGAPPDGRLAGYTEAGNTINIGWQTPPNEAWDYQENYRVVAPNVIAIAGRLVQIRDLALMHYILPPSNVPGDTNWLTFGCAKQPDLVPSVTLIYRYTRSSTPAYGYAMIYRAMNVTPFSINITRRTPAAVDFRFEAIIVQTRPPEDQLGQITTYDVPP